MAHFEVKYGYESLVEAKLEEPGNSILSRHEWKPQLNFSKNNDSIKMSNTNKCHKNMFNVGTYF